MKNLAKIARSMLQYAAMTMPPVLIDCGHIGNARSGLGQVAIQYARALMASSSGEFAFRFLAHPRFGAFRSALGDAVCDAPRFSPAGAVMRLFSKDWRRYVYGKTGHCLRHAIHRNHYAIPGGDRAPFVLTIHDMHLLHDKAKRRARALKQLQQSASRASVVAFISNDAKKAAAEYIDFGDAGQVVIYNGVNKPANPQKPEWFSQLPKSETMPFLFSIAQIAPSKNYILMPPVMHHLPDMNLIIAGRKKPYCAPQIEQKARDEGVAQRVLLPGVVSEGEKAWLLQNCAGFVFPSLREGFGMPVIEAMHFGKPVFCFANTALPEVGGDMAYYWDDDSPKAMAELINKTLACENGENKTARQKWAATFSWQNNTEAYLRIYRRLAKP